MKRILIIAAILLQTTLTFSIDKVALGDTLTQIAKAHAYVGDVRVNKIRVRNQQIFVYTNPTLSHISFTSAEVRDIRLLISQLVLGNNQGKVSIYSGDLELGELITSMHKARGAKTRYTLDNVPAWVRNTSLPYSPTNGLSGKHIALWGSHGRYYHQTMEQWLWQRAKLWTTVEDVYTSSYTMPFLVPMLENAGAVVVQPRERDTQRAEEVVDDTEAMRRLGKRAPHDAGVIGDPVEAMRQWVKGEGTGWGEDNDEVLLEGENPFEKGGYLVAPVSSKEISELLYTPHPLPIGEYAVYVSYKSLPNSTHAAYAVREVIP